MQKKSCSWLSVRPSYFASALTPSGCLTKLHVHSTKSYASYIPCPSFSKSLISFHLGTNFKIIAKYWTLITILHSETGPICNANIFVCVWNPYFCRNCFAHLGCVWACACMRALVCVSVRACVCVFPVYLHILWNERANRYISHRLYGWAPSRYSVWRILMCSVAHGKFQTCTLFGFYEPYKCSFWRMFRGNILVPTSNVK